MLSSQSDDDIVSGIVLAVSAARSNMGRNWMDAVAGLEAAIDLIEQLQARCFVAHPGMAPTRRSELASSGTR